MSAPRMHPTVLERFEMVTTEGLSGWLCRRCTTVNVVATDIVDGVASQEGLTLADLVTEAEEHEAREHGGQVSPDGGQGADGLAAIIADLGAFLNSDDIADPIGLLETLQIRLSELAAKA